MNLYRSLTNLIAPIWKSIQNQPEQNHKHLQLIIKRGHLVPSSNMNKYGDQLYEQFIEESYNNFVVLSARAQGKKYRVHAGTDQEWYGKFVGNCQRSECVKEAEQQIAVEIRFERECAWKVIESGKLNKELQKQLGQKSQYKQHEKCQHQWHGRSRTQKLNRQFNILVEGNEYRVGLNLQVPIQESDNAVDCLVRNKEDENEKQRFVEQMNCIRIKQSRVFYFSECYTIIASRVIQLDNEAEKQQFTKICLSDDAKQMDKYIKFKLRNQQKSSFPSFRYQITLKHLIYPYPSSMPNIFSNPYILNTYLGLLILKFNLIQNQQYDFKWEQQIFNELLIDNSEQQPSIIRIKDKTIQEMSLDYFDEIMDYKDEDGDGDGDAYDEIDREGHKSSYNGQCTNEAFVNGVCEKQESEKYCQNGKNEIIETKKQQLNSE